MMLELTPEIIEALIAVRDWEAGRKEYERHHSHYDWEDLRDFRIGAVGDAVDNSYAKVDTETLRRMLAELRGE